MAKFKVLMVCGSCERFDTWIKFIIRLPPSGRLGGGLTVPKKCLATPKVLFFYFLFFPHKWLS